MKTLIVEDELPNAEGLQILLHKSHKDIEVCGIAPTVSSAVNMIEVIKPELVFMDINLPDGDGFEIFNKINFKNFASIFTTAYQQFALKAFSFSAIDYLLKPINPADLERAIEKVKNTLPIKYDSDYAKFGFQKIPLPVVGGVVFVNIHEIIYCEADNNYTKIHLSNSRLHLVSKTLQVFEDVLPNAIFVRIHRSSIININFIAKFNRGKIAQVELENGVCLPVGDLYRDALQLKLGIT